MYLKSLGLTREELLENVVYDCIFARSNYTNTLLGEPPEVTRTFGVLHGVCIALGIEYSIENKEILFRTIGSNKMILSLEFDPLKAF